MEYTGTPLDPSSIADDPLIQVRRWYDDAVAAALPMPDTMTLATVGADGRPSARMVLLKGIDSGFVFFTNYDSRKGHELAANPVAALVLFWQPLHRQVRVEGTVERVTDAEADDYFRSRPRGSRPHSHRSTRTATGSIRTGSITGPR